MEIGILGLPLRIPQQKDGNLGCYALSYSFFEVLNQIAKQTNITISIVVIQQITNCMGIFKQLVKKIIKYPDACIDYYTNQYSNLSFKKGLYIQRHGHALLSRTVKKCQCVFDFTAGDSFTDIYGKERFYVRTGLKKDIIDNHIPLILGSQTIGPFMDKDVERFAVDVINRCKAVFVRDNISKEYVEKISAVNPILTTDVAFFLPYDKCKKDNTKVRVGFNPSGLLWMGGYDGNNQFGLTVDYKLFCRRYIKYLLDKGAEVHLILHAYFIEDRQDVYSADNDRLAAEQLHKDFPDTIMAPFFDTPMAAKSYIYGMDLFVGARMHATIGALSAGVPVIPFSYSRKFEGLFSSLNYPYVIEGTKWDTQKAIDFAIKCTDELDTLKCDISECQKLIDIKNKFLIESYTDVLNSL